MPPFSSSQVQDCDEISLDASSTCVQPPNKSVRIDLELNEVYIIPRYTEMANHEINSAWFSRSESALIREKLLESISRLNNGEAFDEVTDSTRGLEFFTYHGALKRECNKLRLRRTVMEEQRRQRQQGLYNSERIASLAAACAVNCTEFALCMAEEDEDHALNEAEEYDDEPMLKETKASRSVLKFCCWDYGIICLMRWK